MTSRITELISALTILRNPGASEDSIGRLVTAAGCELPDDYLTYLRAANGAEGFINDETYLRLYSIDDAIECNKVHRELVFWLFFFGSSGSIAGYAFDTRTAKRPVLEVDWIGLDLNPMYERGNSFSEFLEGLSRRKRIR